MVYVYPLFLVVVSRESVRRWFLKAGEILSRDGVRRRGFIAVDETNLSWRAYLWAAREVRLCLYRYLGGRGLGECLRLLEKVKEEDKTVQHILPNTQDKNNREVDKGMDSLKLTVSSDIR